MKSLYFVEPTGFSQSSLLSRNTRNSLLQNSVTDNPVLSSNRSHTTGFKNSYDDLPKSRNFTENGFQLSGQHDLSYRKSVSPIGNHSLLLENSSLNSSRQLGQMSGMKDFDGFQKQNTGTSLLDDSYKTHYSEENSNFLRQNKSVLGNISNLEYSHRSNTDNRKMFTSSTNRQAIDNDKSFGSSSNRNAIENEKSFRSSNRHVIENDKSFGSNGNSFLDDERFSHREHQDTRYDKSNKSLMHAQSNYDLSSGRNKNLRLTSTTSERSSSAKDNLLHQKSLDRSRYADREDEDESEEDESEVQYRRLLEKNNITANLSGTKYEVGKSIIPAKETNWEVMLTIFSNFCQLFID